MMHAWIWEFFDVQTFETKMLQKTRSELWLSSQKVPKIVKLSDVTIASAWWAAFCLYFVTFSKAFSTTSWNLWVRNITGRLQQGSPQCQQGCHIPKNYFSQKMKLSFSQFFFIKYFKILCFEKLLSRINFYHFFGTLRVGRRRGNPRHPSTHSYAIDLLSRLAKNWAWNF